MKAREWLKRGEQAADPIDTFTNVWRGFNNLYYRVQGDSEKAQIKRYLQIAIDTIAATEVLNSHSTEIAYLLSQPVIDMRGTGRDTSQHIAGFNSTSDSVAKLQELFMIVYQIRCNLEHGQKSPTRDRDVQLCASAAPLVIDVVKRDT